MSDLMPPISSADIPVMGMSQKNVFLSMRNHRFNLKY